MTKSMSIHTAKISLVAIFISLLLGCVSDDDTNQSCTSFTDDFTHENQSTISESGSMAKSKNSMWWLNSGAYIFRNNGIASTVQGKLVDADIFRTLYAKSNPVDTDEGYHPQNLIRWVTRTKFKTFTQQVFFNIDTINTSKSPNRNPSNGVLLFHRYQDGNNLYYVGLRVDGYAVIKKKRFGKYTTLKSAIVYPGQYNHDSQPNLLPIKRWIGMKTVMTDTPEGYVNITLYLNDNKRNSGWTLALKAEDTDANPIISEGYAGIRSDFMDVRFSRYSAVENVLKKQKTHSCTAQ